MLSARKKCICQLCTCGRHMCLHGLKDSHLILGEDSPSQLKTRRLETRDRTQPAKQRDLTNGGIQDISAEVDQINAQQVLANAENEEIALNIQDKGNSQINVNGTGNSCSAKQIPKTLPIRPLDNLKTSGETDFRTLHQLHYTQKPSDFTGQLSTINEQQDSWERKHIPKTLPIKKPDSLTLSGPLILETTNKSDFTENVFQSKAGEIAQGEKSPRPRTSLKLSGEFQADSSYQRAFTPKQVKDVVKVKKGTSIISHLKPEGDMSFDTTSLDYRAAVIEKLKLESENNKNTPLKPKLAKPQTGIKVPQVPLQDETTAVTDYRRWNVERPERHKPVDTLQLGDGTTDLDDSPLGLTKTYFDYDTKENDPRWQVSRPVIRKPQNNLGTDKNTDYTTTNEEDFMNERSRYSQSNLTNVTEKNEKEATEIVQSEEVVTKENRVVSTNRNEESNTIESRDSDILQQKVEESSANDIQKEADSRNQIIQSKVQDIEPFASSQSGKVYEPHTENINYAAENGEQMEYVTWDQIRPKPIRPQSNLKQEGGMEFNTTNRSEFIERSMERVKGIRPKTTTKVFEGDFDATTMNQIMFTHDQTERVNPIRPKSNLHLENGQFMDETTTAREYQQWEIKRPSPVVHKPSLMQQGTIDFTTTNRTEFEEKHPEKVYPIRPTTTNRISSGELDLTTTNQIVHGPFPIERVQKIVPQPNLRLNSGIFNSETTNKAQFQGYQLDRPKPIKPVPNLRQEGSMDFTTTNQVQYAGKTSERVTKIRPKTNPKITGEFDGTTTNRMMYQNVSGEKPKSIRPKTNLRMEKGSFIGETTNNREFQNWGYEKPTPIKPHSSLRQEGSMDYTTTNSVQFEAKTTERPEQIRPTTSTKITGDFDGTTTNQIMFQNNPIETVRGIRPSTHIHLENGKFDDQTTARREYQPWEIAKPEPIKPSGTLVQEGTMDFTTSNQTDFGLKPMTKTEAIRPHTTSPITGEFDGTTTNQMMYQAQTIDRVHNIRPKDNLHVENGEFKGETTSSNAYGYKEGMKPQSIKPKSNLSQEGDMEFVTSNQTEYAEKTIEKVSQTRPKTHTKISDGKFYEKTTNQTMFQTPTMETVHALRPSTNLKINEGAFQDSTTVTDAYQKWKTERPKAFQLTSSLKQEGEMSFETTSNSEFKEKSYERVQQIRPKTSSKIEGEFNATTTNQAMFHQPETFERVKPIRHQNNLYLEQGRFSDETTTNREYKQWVKGNQIAVPKKKLQAAGVRTQRERPSRRKEITKEKDSNLITPRDPSNSEMKMNSTEMKNMASDYATAAEDAMTSEQVIGKPEQDAMIRQEQINKENNQATNDISNVKSDYGSKQGAEIEGAATSENLPQTGNQIATSDADETQQVTFVDKKQEENIQKNIAIPETEELKENKDYSSWKLPQSDNTSYGKMSNDRTSRTLDQEEQMLKKQQNNMKGSKRYRPPDNLKIEHVPFDGTSTSRTEYKKWEVRRSSLKKRGEHLKQEGKMQFDTTSNDYSVLKDYPINREITRSKIKEELKKGSLAPAGSMEFSTTSKSSYIGLSNVARPKNLRPRSSLRLGVADSSSQEMLLSSRSNPEISSTRENSDFTSTSRASYVGYTGTRSRANRPSTSQKVGEGAFEGQSTTRSTFTVPQETVVKSKSIKPESHNILHTENGFTGDTTYRSSFESKQTHCPVLDLEAGKLPLAFKEERNGHVFYAPRVQG